MAERKPLKRIAAISMARNDQFFVQKWMQYYGAQIGHENLFLILDGHDQPLPESHELINVIRIPHVKLSRTKGDRNRSNLVSFFARGLFQRYDFVIGHDIDEFLVVDPKLGQSLAEYLQRPFKWASLSALGLDVGQHLEKETPIDPSRLFLEQRSFAHVSARYTKAVVATKPITWGSGFHRVRWKNFHIDPNLFLFHFGMVDFEMAKGKMGDQTLMKAGWTGHLDRRYQLFELILKNNPIDGDSFFASARRRQSLFRPVYAWNKPGMLNEKPIIRIPERFRSVV
jgi:hypothetical protein